MHEWDNTTEFPNQIKSGTDKDKRGILTACSISFIILILDQLTKACIEKYVENPIPVIPGFFNIVHVGNRGAAWGMFQNYPWLLFSISIIFFFGAVFFFRSITEGWLERYYAVALVLGGVLGNSTDRIWRSGKVVDFLDFNLGFMRWPSFNVADSAICIGVTIFILSSFLRPSPDKKTAEEISSIVENN